MGKAFFSVAGEDVEKARGIAAEFAANQVYLYDESGQHAADMWEEEAKELRNSTILVIFWSINYLKKKGTLREIRLAVELLDQRKLGHPLIVRLDNTPLTSVGNLAGDESDGVQLLAPLIERWRALPLPFDNVNTIANVERLLISNGTATPPEFDRSGVLQTLNQLAQTSPRDIKPVIWISGHEGYGRRFIVEKYMRLFDPNSKRIEVTLLDSDGPLQALLRLKGRDFGANVAELEALISNSKDGHGGDNESLLLTQAVQDISAKGGHIIFTIEALNRDANRWIPAWLLKWIETIPKGRKPKVFFVAHFAFPKALLRGDAANKVAALTISSLEFHESKDYGYRLTGNFDVNADRWQPEDMDRLADDSDGNLSLLISLARSRSLAPDLKTFAEDPSDVQAGFTVKLNNYLDGCLTQIRAIPDAVAVLRVLSDLQLVSFSDLKIMFPKADLHALLGRLLDLALLEVPSDGLYRVPRLVVRRLDIRLDVKAAPSSDGLPIHDRFKRLFDKRIVAEAKEPLIDRIEARVRAALLTGVSTVDSHVAKFITASYLLQAGIRAYDKQDYEGALRLLRDCVRHRNEFPEINTRCVMLRYFGLAAAREDKTADTQQAVELLLKEGKSNVWRKSRVNPIADAEFVRGFVCRLNERWSDACRHYLNSLKHMEEDGGSRLGDCHREIAECYLHEQEPNYREARFHALRAYESRDTIMALDIVVKALTASFWSDESLSDRERDELEVKLNYHLDKLQELSTSLGMGMWHQRRAEDLMQSGEFADVEQALIYAKEALAISSRQDFHPLIWKLLIRLNTDKHLNELIELTVDVIANHRFNKRTRSVAARYLIGAYIQLGDFNNAQRFFDQYKSGFPPGVAATIQASIRSRSIEETHWL